MGKDGYRVVLEFPRPLCDATGRQTRETRGWFPATDMEGINDALSRGAWVVGRTASPKKLEQLLQAGEIPMQ